MLHTGHPSEDLAEGGLARRQRLQHLLAMAWREIREFWNVLKLIRFSVLLALVSVAVILAVAEGAITSARVALGGVAHKPWRSPEAERALEGHPASLDTYRAAANVALAAAVGRGHNDFKIELAKRTLIATLDDAAAHSDSRARQ